MKEPIVVGINDSGANEAAVTWAMHRAAALKLPVQLVHAVDDRWMSESFAYNEMANKAATELLIKAKAHAAGVEPTVDVRTVLISGTPGYALRKRSKKASLVVIGSGTHVRLGGRLTDRALQIASVALCPVAVVGEEAVDDRHGVVVGVDGSEESTQAVAFAAAEADREGQELTVLHAYPIPGACLQRGCPRAASSTNSWKKNGGSSPRRSPALRKCTPTSSSTEYWPPTRRPWPSLKLPRRRSCWSSATVAEAESSGCCWAQPPTQSLPSWPAPQSSPAYAGSRTPNRGKGAFPRSVEPAMCWTPDDEQRAFGDVGGGHAEGFPCVSLRTKEP